jgi:FkbM family methyltransferase
MFVNRAAGDLTQRRRWLKRTLLRPIAPAALRWARAGGPVGVRDVLLRKAAFPYLRASDEQFERPVGDGVFVGRTRDMLSMYVLAFGVWEPHLTAFIRQRLAPGDVFVDVGANSGWYTLLGAHRVGPDGQVVAVEPSAAIAERLSWQVTRNALTNVRIVPEAVSDHLGTVAVELGPEEHRGLTRAIHESTGESSVPCRPLPDMIADDEWARVRLMKIDVEGAEYAAVRGLAPALSRLPAAAEVVVEVGPQRAPSPAYVDELFDSFDRAGFRGYAMPNAYAPRDYLAYQPVQSLPRVTGPALRTEVDVVFSRAGDEERLTVQ